MTITMSITLEHKSQYKNIPVNFLIIKNVLPAGFYKRKPFCLGLRTQGPRDDNYKTIVNNTQY